MPDASVATLALTVAVAAAGVAAPLLVLHVAVAHAMRARGVRRWRVRDTALVSPLLLAGLGVGFGSLAYALATVTASSTPGRDDGARLLGCLIVAAGAFVVAGFGARAVGKLY